MRYESGTVVAVCYAGIGVSALRVDFVMRENMGKERCDAEGNREGKGDVRWKK